MTEKRSPGLTGRRTALCVPAVDPQRIANAMNSAADEVVIDLEDAVPPDGKESARAVLARFPWSSYPAGKLIAVRVNAPRSRWCHRDLECVVISVPATSIVLPKVESRGDLDFAERMLDGLEAELPRARRIGVQALIETAAGLARLDDIVSRPDRIDSLILGYADLAASLGRGAGFDAESWLPAQERVLWAARMAGLEAVDGPYLGVAEDAGLSAAARRAATLGFDAKWAIHPRQLGVLEAAFEPPPEALQRARAILDALGSAHSEGAGAVQLDGQLIDEAMALAARRVLAKARQ
jgi:citrate lyase subunit beta/citryl-CoA lyase